MIILNIHGYKGTSQNAAYSALMIFEKNIVSPAIDYDAKSPLAILNELSDICVNQNVDMIVGTSLGGLFASSLAINLNKPLILINPCFQPEIVLPPLGYAGDVNDFLPMEKLIQNINKISVKCIIGGQDEVIGSHDYTKKLLGLDNIEIVPNGYHSGATLNLEKYFEKIFNDQQ